MGHVARRKPDEPGSIVTLTFREDGTFAMEGYIGEGEAGLFEAIFSEPLSDNDMIPEDLAALGFQVPHIIGSSIEGPYSVWGTRFLLQ